MNHLPYELAKQLKDAGFPQNRFSGTFAYDRNASPINYDAGIIPSGIKVPTLSELIEACGEGKYLEIKEWWDATEGGKPKYAWKATCRGLDHWLLGDTPEIAVGKLWLTLNQKEA